MNNADIADILKQFADLSELHGGNPFKIKSYAIAAFRIDKMQEILDGKTVAELEKMEGIGKSVASKVFEITTTGKIQELENLINDTPPGVLELFKVKGIGPKKIAYIWQELGIESVGELLYACKENRLAQAKGFGAKTQDSIKKNIEFIFANANRFHYSNIDRTANQLLEVLRKTPGIITAEPCGALRRKMEVLDEMELVIATEDITQTLQTLSSIPFMQDAIVGERFLRAKINGMIPLQIFVTNKRHFASELFIRTGNETHVSQIKVINPEAESEEQIYSDNGMSFIEPEMREGLNEIDKATNHTLPLLIALKDLKGILHNHSTWSDGANSLEEMAMYCKDLGYQYFGICDHSKSAFYANGLQEERVLQQHIEINKLNLKLAPFKIFKGIESDILYDGQLDYPNEILKQFDFIVASIHSNLKMPEEKAMSRLIRAIENPYTTILGHPTGRLLLMREGYPIDHKKVIDACAANGVVIELNANPYRLDLDWRHIDYALQKNVMISINPDAHEKEGFMDMQYGVAVARKGGLNKEMCFNAFTMEEISTYFDKRRNVIV